MNTHVTSALRLIVPMFVLVACNKSDAANTSTTDAGSAAPAVSQASAVKPAAPAADPNCAKFAKNVAPLVAMSVKGAKMNDLKPLAEKAEPELSAKCNASPAKTSAAVSCFVEAKTLGETEACKGKPGNSDIDKWVDAVLANLTVGANDAIKAAGGEASCDTIKKYSMCREHSSEQVAAAGADFLRTACSDGTFASTACPKDKRVGTCTTPEGTKVYYSTGGFPMKAAELAKECASGVPSGTWAAAH